MLKDPIKQAKELSNDKRSNEKLELFQNIFDIDTQTLMRILKLVKHKEKEVSIRHIFSFE